MNEDAQQVRLSPESEWFHPPARARRTGPHP